MRSIHLGLYALFTSAVLMVSCAEDELIENNHHLTSSETINFDAIVEWPEDYMDSRSATSSLKRVESPKLRAEEGNETLPMGVYVQDGIYPTSTPNPESRGAVITQDQLASFNVWATLNKAENVGGGAIEYFSNVEYTKGNDDVFSSSGKVYYWPGEGPTIDFVAVGNAPESGFTANMANNEATSFTYTVDQDATKQNDIVLAKAPNIAGNNDESVPLDFKHILSAVNVKVGSQMTAGTINSITFKNIKSKGIYDVANGTWGSVDEPKDYTITFANGSSNYATDGKTEGTLINGDNATLMMIPQTLANISDTEKVEIIVNFSYAASGQTKDLIASLDGQAWAMGKTTNYYINVSPDFTLSIEEESVPIADCHYDTRVINIKNEHSNVEWTLSSDVDWVKFRLVPDDYETNENYANYREYWIETQSVRTINKTIDKIKETDQETIDSDNTVLYPIESTLTGSGNAKVLVYYYESIDDNNENTRKATISLKDNNGKEWSNGFILEQYNPIWNNGLAYERIEENKGTFPWGFASTRTVVYSYPNINDVNWGNLQWLWEAIVRYKGHWLLDILGWLQAIYDNVIGDKLTDRNSAYNTFKTTYADNSVSGFITMTGSADSDWSATLDYSKLNSIVANGSGLENTKLITTYAGGETGSDAETWLTNNNMVKGTETNTTDNTTIPQTAAYQALKKNKWKLTTIITNITRIIEYDNDVYEQKESNVVNTMNSASDDIEWFLPSKDEITILKPTACDDDTSNNDEALTGTYWTSTSGTGTNAFYYNAADETATEISRAATNKHKIRAARIKPTN
ncbi:MAG: fimbrillin family protein [Alistipes sp.]|nr:fimbrillin family protein [Alistipes sp.]